MISAILLALTACTRSSKPAVSVEHGRSVYTASCAACHGMDGRSNPTHNSPLAGNDRMKQDLEDIAGVTLYGQPGTTMVGFDGVLSHNDIAAVIAFVRKEFAGITDDSDAIVTAVEIATQTGPGVQ